VPPEARWQPLKAQARQATIGRLVDDAMAGIACNGNADFAWVPQEEPLL
jgi:type I restriction enzyme M protein